MADDRITYTIIVDYTANGATDVHFAELKTQTKTLMQKYLNARKGVALAKLVSIADDT